MFFDIFDSEEREDIYDDNLNYTFKICHIYLINKAALLNLLIEQESTFSEYLGKGFSPREFLVKVESSKTLMPHLNKSETLLGIVLGYGLESALRFEKLQDNSSFSSEIGFCQAITSPSPEECKIESVVFMGNPNSIEVQAIKDRYGAAIQNIWKVYKDKQFLVSVIQALCSNG